MGFSDHLIEYGDGHKEDPGGRSNLLSSSLRLNSVSREQASGVGSIKGPGPRRSPAEPSPGSLKNPARKPPYRVKPGNSEKLLLEPLRAPTKPFPEVSNPLFVAHCVCLLPILHLFSGCPLFIIV